MSAKRSKWQKGDVLVDVVRSNSGLIHLRISGGSLRDETLTVKDAKDLLSVYAQLHDAGFKRLEVTS